MGGSYLTKPNTTKETESGSYGPIEYAMSCMQGWRQNMEDAHICDPKFDVDTQLYAVFDGHGGFEVAIFIAKHFSRELKENAAYKAKDFPTALKQTFLKMDELLLTEDGRYDLLQIVKTRTPEQQQVQNTAGCTANVTLLYKNFIYVANAGDSRCVLSVEGKNEDLSKDHKPDDELELNRIKNAGGSVTNGRVNGNLNLSRALGDLTFKENKDLKPEEQLISPMPDVVVHELTHKDEFLLIGCDGIWELKTNQELVTICRKGLVEHVPMTKIVEDLLDQIIAKDTTQGLGCDNMSAILVKLKRNIVQPDAEPDKDCILANGVLDKYKAAGQISDLVVEEIIKKIKVNANIVELCQFGDELVDAEVKKVFQKDKNKGVAYPTSITLNELIANYAPLKNTTDNKNLYTIKKGDLVKISVGVQIDGFVAEAAQTVVCSEGAVVDGVKADVIHAAYHGLQAALRTLNPEKINTDTLNIINRTANIFKCTPVADVRSYEVKRNNFQSKFFIPSLEDVSSKNPFFTYRFEQYEVYTLNVTVSTGSGVPAHIEGLPQSNIYQAHPEKHLVRVGIKKNAQTLYDNVMEHHPSFFFSTRQFIEDPTLDKVLQEFKKQGVFTQLPIESEEPGKYVATFKITVAISSGGLTLFSGLKLENALANYKSAFTTNSDEEIKTLLEKDVLKKKKTKSKKK